MQSFRLFIRVIAVATISALLSACSGGGSTPAVNQTANKQTGASVMFGHRPYGPPPHPPAPTVTITAADRAAARANGWTRVTAKAPFGSNGAGTALLMTDGSVLIQDNTSNWYSLTPDVTGSYVNGAWRKKASMPGGYGPLYFASAVLPDGKVIVNGGEYNFFQPAETNLGAIYDPIGNVWKPVNPPSGWGEIGDAQSAVLADGTYMLGNCCTNVQALLDESTMTWTQTGAGKADDNSEEGWTLLPNGELLAADVLDAPNSELYNPPTGSWSSAGSLPANLTLATEMGPQILRQDGSVLVLGANGQTAVFSTSGAWSAGPTLPTIGGQQLNITDGPATLLTNGNVMFAASPGVYKAPAYIFVYTTTGKLIQLPGPPNAPNDACYNLRLLLLPNGQVLETDGTNDVEVYTPHSAPNTALAPVIQSVPTTLTRGHVYTATGLYFNGFSQANTYGDDAQMASNYPLVKIVNTASGNVYFARTSGFSSMAVASSSPVTTNFHLPKAMEIGPSQLTVVTNGITSAPVNVTVQ